MSEAPQLDPSRTGTGLTAIGPNHAPVSLGAPVSLDPSALVMAHTGPALLLDGAAQVLIANPAGQVIAETLGDPARARLAADIAASAAAMAPRTHKITVEQGLASAERSFELTVLPVRIEDGAPRLLVIGSETTLERNLTKALVASRELFRDLVACSADFAWETDHRGVLTYVSPRGAIGYSAHALNGRLAGSLMLRSRGGPDLPAVAGENPFTATKPVTDREIWLRGASGQRHCMLTSAVPQFDADGTWCGTRGVCREVTELRLREAEVARARERERMVSQVVEAMRADIDPAEILASTAAATAEAADAALCWVLIADEHGRYLPERAHWASAGGTGTPLAPERAAATLADLVEALEGYGKPADAPVEATAEGVRGLALATAFQGRRNGAICLFRSAQDADWTDATRLLIESVGLHAGIAIAQARHTSQLQTLSRIDPLTGLLNRRAFLDEVAGRLPGPAADQGGPGGALLYFDLDHFKDVNDRYGHGRGDEVLSTFAGLLRENIRAGDSAARFGGDEFVVWLDGAARTGAMRKARDLCALDEQLKRRFELPDAFSVSAGLAMAAGGRAIAITDLLEAADEALYAAKKAGRSGLAIVDKTESETGTPA